MSKRLINKITQLASSVKMTQDRGTKIAVASYACGLRNEINRLTKSLKLVKKAQVQISSGKSVMAQKYFKVSLAEHQNLSQEEKATRIIEDIKATAAQENIELKDFCESIDRIYPSLNRTICNPPKMD
ncbi:hypothetical protein V9T40_003878 [Parthenolecanium corni]|uniref:Uncharacterized protein n=1 Tax=Parthenolecanium corni TaxID=536013 RepID=A0AAN9TGE4_9HEMI